MVPGKIELTLLVLGGLLGLVMAFADLTILPALAIALIVVGGIYGGVFTPTEGAAVGTIAMLAAGCSSAASPLRTSAKPCGRRR